MNYKEDSKVDIYSLHTEWAGQSRMYTEYAEIYADSIKIMMRADEKVKVTRTEGKRKIDETRAWLDGDVRSDPYLYGLPTDKKPTEAQIAAAIVQAEKFKAVQDEVAREVAEAVEEHVKAVGNKELLDKVLIGLSHRKTALENEVTLWLNGYYSDPKIPKPYQRAQEEEVKKKIEETLKDRLPLKRRRGRSEEGEG